MNRKIIRQNRRNKIIKIILFRIFLNITNKNDYIIVGFKIIYYDLIL